MKIELSQKNKDFMLALLYEEKSRLISKFRKKAHADVVCSPCDFNKKMFQVRELISILGDCDE
jgi:hypothetical protein